MFGEHGQAVEKSRPEQLTERVRPLEDQVGVVLPGDRDAPVNLDRLGGHVAQRLGAPRPRYRLQTMCEGGGQANVTVVERL